MVLVVVVVVVVDDDYVENEIVSLPVYRFSIHTFSFIEPTLRAEMYCNSYVTHNFHYSSIEIVIADSRVLFMPNNIVVQLSDEGGEHDFNPFNV